MSENGKRRIKWSQKLEAQLRGYIAQGLSLDEIKAQHGHFFPPVSINTKYVEQLEIVKRLNAGEKVKVTDGPRPYSPEELELIFELRRRKTPNKVILEEITKLLKPGEKPRTDLALRMKLVDVDAVIRKDNATLLDGLKNSLVLFATTALSAFVPKTRTAVSTTLDYLTTLAFFIPKNIEKAVEICRKAILEAQEQNKNMVAFTLVNPDDFEKKPGLGSLQPYSPLQQQLLRASLLTDGHINKVGNHFTFQFTQSAIPLPNGRSHLEYVLWFVNIFDWSFLSPSAFKLVKGVPISQEKIVETSENVVDMVLLEKEGNESFVGDFENPSNSEEDLKVKSDSQSVQALKGKNTQKKAKTPKLDWFLRSSFMCSWKARFFLYKNPLLAELYAENYMSPSEKQEIFNISLTSNQSNYKILPSIPTLLKKYFVDPYYALAHMYMQDGSLNKFSVHMGLPAFYIQTLDCNALKRLALVIYKKTGIRFNVFSTERTGKEYFWLEMCPSDRGIWIEKVEPYLLPCFDYKKIVVDETQLTDYFFQLASENDDFFKEDILDQEAAIVEEDQRISANLAEIRSRSRNP